MVETPFGARTNHEHTWTHKTHHGPDLGEALIVISTFGHGACTQMSFCLEIPKIETSAILDAHKFL
jgi:hypothetical protein